MRAGNNGVTEKTVKNIPFGAGTIHKGLKYIAESGWNFAESCVGATKGGSSVKIEPEFYSVEPDGSTVAIKDFKRKVGEKATMEITLSNLQRISSRRLLSVHLKLPTFQALIIHCLHQKRISRRATIGRTSHLSVKLLTVKILSLFCLTPFVLPVFPLTVRTARRVWASTHLSVTPMFRQALQLCLTRFTIQKQLHNNTKGDIIS